MPDEPHFFRPVEDIKVTRNRLPHWQQNGNVFFVTYRLSDSLPAHLLRGWSQERESWLRQNPPPHSTEKELEYHQHFSTRIEQWLDAGHGCCALRHHDMREQVVQTLLFFEGNRCQQTAFIVMPNHVHALFSLLDGVDLGKLLMSWKSYAGREIGKLQGSRTWPGWQKDYFDRLIRNEQHLANCVRYIRRNPAKASLSEGEFHLWESPQAKAIV